MRNLVIAFVAASAALPAIAGGQSFRLDIMADRWAATAAQSPWTEPSAAPVRALDRVVAATPGFAYDGEGWSSLDGWMRGDPTLRHWVLHRFDLDADGRLSPDEGGMARRGFYAIADVNRSDRITREEFVAGWSEIRRELQSFYAIGVDRA